MASRRPWATFTGSGSSKVARGQRPEPRQLIPKSRGRTSRLYREIGFVEEGAAAERVNSMLMAVMKVVDFMFADARVGCVR
jgi:hypothetical protein